MDERVRVGHPRLRSRGRRARAPHPRPRRRDRGARRRAARGGPGRGAQPRQGARPAAAEPVLHRRRRARWSTIRDVDVVVEVIGGIEPARALIVDALMARQARRHREQGAAREPRRASCSRPPRARASTSCSRRRWRGGIPLIRPLRESLAGDRIRRVMGIVNGTTNYILTRMTEAGASFADALAEAQELGFAETRPHRRRRGLRRRGEGRDHRVASRSARASSPATCTARASPRSRADDIASARELGYVVKLLAVAEEIDGEVAVRVHPGDGARSPSARVGARLVQRGVHRGRRRRASSCSTAAARAAMPTASRGARRPRRRGEEPGRGAQGRDHRHARPRSRSAPIDEVESQFYLHARGRRPPRRARRDRRASSATSACRSGRCSRRGIRARTPASSSSPTRREEADLPRHGRRALRDARRRSHRVGAVLRVIGEEE